MEFSHTQRKGPMIGVFVLGVFVGFSGYWALVDQGLVNKISVYGGADVVLEEELRTEGSGINVEESDLTNSVLSFSAQGENSIIVSDQPMGNQTILSMLLLEQSAWVAIHEIGEGGAPGTILGARRFNIDTYFGEKIELLRDTQEGESYLAVLHADDGNNEFDFKREVPLEDLAGDLITAEFIATSNAGRSF